LEFVDYSGKGQVNVMCGIAGHFGLSLHPNERKPLLQRMTQTIVHRGPNDDGYFSAESVGLGMRRLSIIDLKTGHQPISSPTGKQHIVFNGEIYNYQELRSRLLVDGYPFSTGSDTEVILNQFLKDGPDCVHQLNGMFAFAIWDVVQQSLFLARDRMGIKPLYYFWDGKCLIFASEIKAILASGYVSRSLNIQALWDYLTFRYVPQPETIWENIYKLPPGHTLTISEKLPEPCITRYWDIPYHDRGSSLSETEHFEEFSHLFLDAVRLRLIADVPVGILLSGGIDSSAVAAAVAEQHNAPLSSFSVAFKDAPQISELPYARQMADWAGMEHNEIVIGQEEFMAFLPELVYFTDEPLADLASVPLYYVSRLAGEKVKVVLSGEGSDEILGGYDFDRFMRDVDRSRTYQRLPGWLRTPGGLAFLHRFAGTQFDRRYQINDAPLDLRRHAVPPHMTNYLTSKQKADLFVRVIGLRDSMDIVRADIRRSHTAEPLHQMLYTYCQSWLVEDLLMKADRASMANSIELRTPFLDYRLVEWAARAPTFVKVGHDPSGRYETKRALRAFSNGRVPEAILQRPKMGFPVPVYEWLSGSLKAWASDLLHSRDAKLYCWLHRDAVLHQLQTAIAPGSPVLERHRLWNLLIFELWCHQWNPE
jgi:asparagine synthase (glutamine-hydrolysing)